MILGQSVPGSEFRMNDPIWHINPLILRQSAIFGDVLSPKMRVWIEQTASSDWTGIDVPDIEVARFDE